MKITEKFTLLEGVPNILNLSKSQIETFTSEENTPKHVYATLELKKSVIRHDGFKKILDYVRNVKQTQDLNVLVNPQYPLVVSYSQKAHSKIINILPFNAQDLAKVSYNNLYGALLYAYTFDSFVNGRLRVPDSMAQVITNYWYSLFMRVFGRAYGLTGTYSSKLPALKFLITAYILITFFGRKQDRATYNLAKQYSGFQYDDILDILNRVDLSNIRGFVQALSLSETFPGFNVIRFTTVIHRRFDVQMLPFFEDLARFMSLIMTSSYAQQNFAKSFIRTYQPKSYVTMYDFMKKKLF